MFWLSAWVKAGLLENVVDEIPLAATVPAMFVGRWACTEAMRFS